MEPGVPITTTGAFYWSTKSFLTLALLLCTKIWKSRGSQTSLTSCSISFKCYLRFVKIIIWGTFVVGLTNSSIFPRWQIPDSLSLGLTLLVLESFWSSSWLNMSIIEFWAKVIELMRVCYARDSKFRARINLWDFTIGLPLGLQIFFGDSVSFGSIAVWILGFVFWSWAWSFYRVLVWFSSQSLALMIFLLF